MSIEDVKRFGGDAPIEEGPPETLDCFAHIENLIRARMEEK